MPLPGGQLRAAGQGFKAARAAQHRLSLAGSPRVLGSPGPDCQPQGLTAGQRPGRAAQASTSLCRMSVSVTTPHGTSASSAATLHTYTLQAGGWVGGRGRESVCTCLHAHHAN